MNEAQTEWIVKYGNEYGRSLSMQMMNALHGAQFLMTWRGEQQRQCA